MACGATLKRSLDLDPLLSPRSPKRRRCMPMIMSPTQKPQNKAPSPFAEITPKLASDQIAAKLALEVKRMQRRRQLMYPNSSSPPPSTSSNSYPLSTSPPLSGSPPPLESCSISHLPGTSSPTSSAFFNALSPNKKDTPLFTFKQVSLVCERMLKEREEAIRQEYDKVLTCKLAEQYEAFLKFNHDQIQKIFSESPASYVS